MAIIRHLFRLLTTEDPEIFRIFFAWIRGESVNEVRAGAAV
jgi:hypothetical protein